MKKYLTLLALLSLLFVNESDAQKLTFLDSFEIYHHSNPSGYLDTFPNIFEDSTGKLVGFGVDRSRDYFYEFTLINGEFEKTDSAEFVGDDDMGFRVGDEYKGVRSITHHSPWPKLSSSTSSMALKGANQKYKTLGSWKKGDGFANFSRNLKDSNLIVHQFERGFTYKGLYHFHGEVIGQGHNGEKGLYSFDGTAIKKIPLDVQNDLDFPEWFSNFQIENDVIYFKGIKGGNINRNVYSCNYKTGKLLKSDSAFKNDGLRYQNEHQFDIREIEGGGYFRLVKLKSSNTFKLQVTDLGTIDPPDNVYHILDGAWHNNSFYLAHMIRANGTSPYQGYISKYTNGKWTSTTFELDWGLWSTRFVKGSKRLILTFIPYRPSGGPVVHHVYSIDDLLKSVERVKTEPISIFPNPTNGIVNIQSSLNRKINRIEISNMMGVKLTEYEISDSNYQLDISNLPNGMYIIRLNGRESVRVMKID